MLLPFISNSLLLDEALHGIVALPFSYFIWKKTHSYPKAALVVLTVYAIDSDHLVDFWSYYGLSFNIHNFFNTEYFRFNQKGYVPFHAWEWVVALAWLASRRKKPWNTWFASLGTGIFAHLLWDTYSIGSTVFYSITYRIFTNFALL
jgi:hypothetical protein